VLLHLAVAVAVAVCLVAAWWQLARARSGNWRSYAYAVEWPAFAVVAVVGWWQLIHDEGRRAPAGDESDRSGADEVPPWAQRRVESETPELRAYNDYLEELAEANARKAGRAQRPR